MMEQFDSLPPLRGTSLGFFDGIINAQDATLTSQCILVGIPIPSGMLHCTNH